MSSRPPTDVRSMRGRWPARSLGFVAVSVIAARFALAAPRDVAISEAVPRLGDHPVLNWREGPPYITNANPLNHPL